MYSYFEICLYKATLIFYFLVYESAAVRRLPNTNIFEKYTKKKNNFLDKEFNNWQFLTKLKHIRCALFLMVELMVCSFCDGRAYGEEHKTC